MQLTWHGHATWAVTVEDTTLLIDPFFSNPKTDLDATDVPVPDYLLLTHGHADHIDDVDRFAPETTTVATLELATWVGDKFGGETIGMNVGGTVELGDAYVTQLQAMHTNSLYGEIGRDVGIPTGYVISDTHPTDLAGNEATTFYHTGDTSLMTEMRDVVGPFLQPDAVAVPIGDHFTMGPQQAAIAVDWLDANVAYPMHYDTFAPIEQDPADFADAVAATGSTAAVVVPTPDEPFTLDL